MEMESTFGGSGALGAARADALAGKTWCSEGSGGPRRQPPPTSLP